MRLPAAFALAVSLPALAPVGLARAADLLPPVPPLEEPGAPSFTWDGLYGGIHAGGGAADFSRDVDLSGIVRSSYAVPPPATLSSLVSLPGRRSVQGPLVGAFAGYNMMFDDAMVGVDVGYSYFWNSLRGTAAGSATLVSDNGTTTGVLTYNAAAGARLSDYVDLRLRGGYAFGRMLFYGTLGLVVANQKVTTSLSSSYTTYPTGSTTPTNVAVALPYALSQSAYNVGLSAGVGLDVAVTDNLFVRAEYEYIAMNKYKGVDTSLQTGKLGVAVKY